MNTTKVASECPKLNASVLHTLSTFWTHLIKVNNISFFPGWIQFQKSHTFVRLEENPLRQFSKKSCNTCAAQKLFGHQKNEIALQTANRFQRILLHAVKMEES